MKFDLYNAESVKHAIELLSEFGEKGKIIAGGTDFLIKVFNEEYLPQAVVDVTLIPALNQIENQPGKGLTIGSAVSHAEICRYSGINKQKYTALIEACSQLGSLQIRNLATVGGNICNAAPSAETAPPLIVLNCLARIEGPSGAREIELENFFLGPSQTVLKENELLTVLKLAPLPAYAGSAYLRLSPRNALDIAIVNVAVYVKLDSDQRFEDVRIGLGAVAPTPIRAPRAENTLIGEKMSEKLIFNVGELAKEHSICISDIRATASYRKEMVSILTQRALCVAYKRASDNGNEL